TPRSSSERQKPRRQRIFGVIPVRPFNWRSLLSTLAEKGMRWIVTLGNFFGPPEIAFLADGSFRRLVVAQVIAMGNMRAQSLEKRLIYFRVCGEQNYLLTRMWEVMLNEVPSVVTIKTSQGRINHNRQGPPRCFGQTP